MSETQVMRIEDDDPNLAIVVRQKSHGRTGSHGFDIQLSFELRHLTTDRGLNAYTHTHTRTIDSRSTITSSSILQLSRRNAALSLPHFDEISLIRMLTPASSQHEHIERQQSRTLVLRVVSSSG